MRKIAPIWVIAGVVSILSSPARAAVGWTDGPGNLRGMNLQGQVVPITGEIWMPRQGWGATARSGSTGAVSRVSFTSPGGLNRWQGTVTDADVGFTYDQTVEQRAEEVVFTITVTSLTDAPTEGLFYFFHLPVAPFAGGTSRTRVAGTETGAVTLPPTLPENPRILFANADSVSTVDSQGNLQFDIALDRPLPAAVQDDRAWKSPVYSIYFRFHSGSLARSQQASLQFTLRLTGEPDRSPGEILVDTSGTGRMFAGWGGNFVYGLDCPECDYLINNLRVSWARTGMSLDLWEPENDDASPATTDWNKLRSKVTPGSTLEREFRIAGVLAERGIPLIMSAWHLPKWLHAGPGTEVPRDRWPELFETITSFLQHARAEYHAEADLFSFNEPDYGVDVRFSPEAHRDFIKALGEHFAAAGLRTKMLLADVTNPGVPVSYAYPAAEDPAALANVGAVSVHSWAWSEYDSWEKGLQAWSELAAQLNKPFLVTEVGADASAWHSPWLFGTFEYALDDLHNYMALLRSGHPLAALQWEYTCDYGLVNVRGTAPVLTPRFHFLRHFSELTPAGSEHLGASSSRDDLLCAAFRARTAKGGRYLLHVANLGAGRRVTIHGLPRGIDWLYGVRTSETETLSPVERVPVADGACSLELTSQSLLTLSGRTTTRR